MTAFFRFPDEIPKVGQIVQIRFVDEGGNDYVLETVVIARIRIKNEKTSQIHLHLQPPNSFFDGIDNLGELVLTTEYASNKPIIKWLGNSKAHCKIRNREISLFVLK